MSATNLSLQNQLDDLTEKYNALQERAKHLELENNEYQKELRNISQKDNELEMTLEELNRTQTQIEEQQSLLTNENKQNIAMLEEESDINNELQLRINENMSTINKLMKTNKILTETNNKYEYELKNINEKMIKLENDYKNKIQQYKEKTEENEFLSTELQILQSVFANQYKNTLNANNNELSPQIVPLLPANKTIELLTPLGNLLPPKTIDYNYKFSGNNLLSPLISQSPLSQEIDGKSPLQLEDMYSNDNQMTFFAMNAVSRDNTLRSNPDIDIYSGGDAIIYGDYSRGSTLRSNDNNNETITMTNNGSYNISIDLFDNDNNNNEETDSENKNINYYKFKRYKQMSSRIIGINEKKEIKLNNNEIIMDEMNKQRMEYEILLQSLNDENQLLINKLQILNNEKNELIEKYNKINEKNENIIENKTENNELLDKYKNLLETHNKCIQIENKLNEKVKLINKLNRKNRQLTDQVQTLTVTDSTSDERCYSVTKWLEFCKISN